MENNYNENEQPLEENTADEATNEPIAETAEPQADGATETEEAAENTVFAEDGALEESGASLDAENADVSEENPWAEDAENSPKPRGAFKRFLASAWFKRIIAAVLVLALLACGGIWVNKEYINITLNGDTVLGKVGDQKIYLYEVKYEMMLGYTSVDQAIENVAHQKALLCIAKKNKVTLSDEQNQLVTDQINKMAENFGDQFDMILENIGITRAQLTSLLKNELLAQELTKQAGTLGLVEGAPDDATLKECFNRDFLRAKHILIAVSENGENAKTKEEALAEATGIANRLKNGESIDDLMALSDDTGAESYPNGYIFFNSTLYPDMDEAAVSALSSSNLIMVSEFTKATAALKPGEFSEPIETTYGYHVIQRLTLDDSIFEDNKSAALNGWMQLHPAEYEVYKTSLETFMTEAYAKYPAKLKKHKVNAYIVQNVREQEAYEQQMNSMYTAE